MRVDKVASTPSRVRSGFDIDPTRHRIESFTEHNLADTTNVAPQLGPTGQLDGDGEGLGGHPTTELNR